MSASAAGRANQVPPPLSGSLFTVALEVALEGAAGRKVPVKIDEQAVAEALVGVYRPIDPGKHQVVAYPPGLRPVEQSVSLGDGERQEVKLVIPPGPLPSGVPGTLIIRFGRSTAFQSRCASDTVAVASCAEPGETSSET